MIKSITNFIKWETSAGIILVLMAALAMIISNSDYAGLYRIFLETKLTISYGEFGLSKPLNLWINDGLMAIFFLLVGLEIKRELIEGELNSRQKAMLPCVAALGGMVVPSLIYAFINWHDPIAIRGWAIPAATDIAFALGLLSLLGKRVPVSLKVLLTAIAIIDDLGAIVIIALFYTEHLSYSLLISALILVALLVYFNRKGITSFAPYAIVGVVLWVLVLKSGIHATLAGVAIAFAYPIRSRTDKRISPLRRLETALHPWIAYGVIPLFAFANAGVPLTDFTFKTLLDPIPLGIALGLFFGKQAGIFLFSLVVIKTGIGKLPKGSTWSQLYGISILCGIGFTMSLFIGALAFVNHGVNYSAMLRIGVLAGSIVSGIVGYTILHFSSGYPDKNKQ